MKFFDQFFQSQSDSESPSLIKRLGVKKIAIICGIAVAVLALVIGLAIGLSGGDEPEQQLPGDQPSQDTPPDSTVPDQGNQSDVPQQDTPEIQPTAFNTLVGTFTNREIKDEASAILAVQDVAKDLSYTNATDELTTVSVNTVDNLTYYRLQQNYQGIPVYGSTFVVIADENGVAQGLTGNAADANENISLIPTVDRKTIQQKMADHFGAGAICSELTEDSLTIYHDKNTGKQMLAYALTALINGEPYSVVVDAATGEVLQSYTLVYTSDDAPTVKEMLRDRVDVYNANGMQFCRWTVYIEGVEHIFSRNSTDHIYDWSGRLKYRSQGDNIVDMQGNVVDVSAWTLRDILYLLEPTGVDTVRYHQLEKMDEATGITNNERASELVEELANAHGFFSAILERNGYDGKDGEIVAAVDDVLYNANAYSSSWSDKTIICIGTNEPITTDLVGHEYMHSVERSMVGMEYSGESGAIMEAYSDIFGELVEDWAEDHKLDGSCDWEHGYRQMHNPIRILDTSCLAVYPNAYKGLGYLDPEEYSNYDHGAVHHNSTVISYAAAYMARDPKGLSDETSLTIDEIAELWYKTLLLLPADCTFEVLRDRMEATAIIMNLSRDKQAHVREAFDLVKIESNSENVNTNLKLCVLDEDLDAFNNCTVSIQQSYDSGFLWWTTEKFKEYQKISFLSINPIDLVLPEGNYRLVITNNSDTDKVYVKHISVKDKYEDDNVIVYTYFEKSSAHVHVYTDWITITQPTELTPGERVRSCTYCAETQTEEIPVIVHTHLYTVSTQPSTCTVAGWTKEICECGEEQNVTPLPLLAHTAVIDPAVPATCTTPGLTEGSHCSQCGAVIQAQTMVSAEHRYQNRKCLLCGAADPSGECGKPVFLTENGIEIGRGNKLKLAWTAPERPVSGVSYYIGIINMADGGAYSEVTSEWITETSYEVHPRFLPEMGTYVVMLYAYAEGYTQSQVAINVIVNNDEHIHTPVDDPAVPATCVKPGLTEGSHCSECDEIISPQTMVPATGHKYQDGVCTVCGAEQSSTICDPVVIMTQNGIELQQGQSLLLAWIPPITPPSNVQYFVDIIDIDRDTRTEVTSFWITDTLQWIDSQFMPHEGTYVVTVYARAAGYEQSQSSINVMVKEHVPTESNSRIEGTVSAYGTGISTQALANATVKLYFAMNPSTPIRTVKTDSNGKFNFTVSMGSYILEISADGYRTLISNQTVGEGEIKYTEHILLIDNSQSGVGNVGGKVSNALDGRGLNGVTIKLRSDWNNMNGSYLDFQTKTNASGRYMLEGIPVGYYTVEASLDGFVTGYTNVIVLSSADKDDFDFTITPILSNNVIRIVLTWGNTPADLDSHLIGRTPSDDSFNVYYSDRVYRYGGKEMANLDVDDITGYGPETITILENVYGTYTYAVHNYTNRRSTNSKALSFSGAVVRVFIGNDQVAEYHVPTDQVGTYWNVFDITADGQIIPINTISNNKPVVASKNG